MSSVLYNAQQRIATITINRPEVRNAVDGPTAQLLQDAFGEAENDDGTDVVILTGAAGTFCAGADLGAIADNRGNTDTQPDAEAIIDSLGPMGPSRRVMSKPVIAAVEGHAVAGGLELALWCDLRVAAQDAIFGVYCRRWGVPLVDGGTVRLPRLIGHSHAMDLILTGRPVSGDEAKQMGLANRLTAPGNALAGATDLAQAISDFPQRCVRSDRQSATEQWGLSEAEALANEIELGMGTIRSGETQEGASRFASGEGRHGAF
jgi:enoyl-CoA hydratase